MATINISLPTTLKSQAENAVGLGLYSSFSDFVRTAMREHLAAIKYNVWAEEAKKEKREGKGTIIKSDAELDAYFRKLKLRTMKNSNI